MSDLVHSSVMDGIATVTMNRPEKRNALSIELIEAFIQAPDETAMSAILEKHKDDITDEFLQFLTSLTTQIETQKNQPETIQRLKDVYHSVLRFSMQQNMNQAS